VRVRKPELGFATPTRAIDLSITLCQQLLHRAGHSPERGETAPVRKVYVSTAPVLDPIEVTGAGDGAMHGLRHRHTAKVVDNSNSQISNATEPALDPTG
jgi:hypothetical protein